MQGHSGELSTVIWRQRQTSML